MTHDMKLAPRRVVVLRSRRKAPILQMDFAPFSPPSFRAEEQFVFAKVEADSSLGMFRLLCKELRESRLWLRPAARAVHAIPNPQIHTAQYIDRNRTTSK